MQARDILNSFIWSRHEKGRLFIVVKLNGVLETDPYLRKTYADILTEEEHADLKRAWVEAISGKLREISGQTSPAHVVVDELPTIDSPLQEIIDSFIGMNPEKGPVFIVTLMNTMLDTETEMIAGAASALTDQEVENVTEDWRNCYKSVLEKVKGIQADEVEGELADRWGDFLSVPMISVGN